METYLKTLRVAWVMEERERILTQLEDVAMTFDRDEWHISWAHAADIIRDEQ